LYGGNVLISFLINAIKIIFLLGFLILIHEGGHFLVAKFFNVKVNEFSLGFGKKIKSVKKGDTEYSIRMLPLGGFVSMEGEEERSEDERSFSKLPIIKRIAIVIAGATVNIIFGLITYFILMAVAGNFYSTTVNSIIDGYNAGEVGIKANDRIVSVDGKRVHSKLDISNYIDKTKDKEVSLDVERSGEIKSFNVKPTEVITKTIGIYLGTEKNASNKIDSVYDESPAKTAGLKKGDIITKVDGNDIKDGDYNSVISFIQNSENDKIEIEVNRNGKIINYKIEPIINKSYYLGVVFNKVDKNFKTANYYAFWDTIEFIKTLGENLKELFTGKVGADQMMGPIGISSTVAKTSSIQEFIYLMALVSLSLGITNLLPIPALDGGKIVLLIIEGIKGKPLNQKFEIGVQMLGFLFIILLSIYVSFNDIHRLI